MTVEQALSSPPSVAELHSPPKQEDNLQVDFYIESRDDMKRDLVSGGLIELFNDAKGIISDYHKSFWEYVNLVSHPMYWGYGLPRGDGSPVIYVGGLGTVELNYLAPIHAMRKAGHNAKTFPWGGLNLGPIRDVGLRLKKFVKEEVEETGKKAKLVLHSLGGYEGLAFFDDNPEEFAGLVDEVVIDASPKPKRLNKALEFAYLVLTFWQSPESYHALSERAELLKDLENAQILKVTTIDSSSDPFIQGDPFGRAQDHYVIKDASHAGMASVKESVVITAHRFAGADIDPLKHPRIILPFAA